MNSLPEYGCAFEPSLFGEAWVAKSKEEYHEASHDEGVNILRKICLLKQRHCWCLWL